jgi:hypothetical protein
MRRTKTLALWAILCCGSLSGRAEVDSFTICSPAAVGRIEVRYFLAGAFGGYGGFVRDSDEDGAYRIPLEQDGRMADEDAFLELLVVERSTGNIVEPVLPSADLQLRGRWSENLAELRLRD